MTIMEVARIWEKEPKRRFRLSYDEDRWLDHARGCVGDRWNSIATLNASELLSDDWEEVTE